MALELRQSTAVTLKIGPFEDDTGAAATGLTLTQADIRLSKNGGNIAQKTESTSATHDELGVYDCPVDATDTGTLGRLELYVGESGALLVRHEYNVISAFEWDRKYTSASPRLSGVITYGTAQSASDTGLVLAAAEAFADNTLIGAVIVAHGSTQGYTQRRVITDSALSGDSVTVDTWDVTPTGTITYVIYETAPGSLTAPVPSDVRMYGGSAGTFSGGRPEVNTTHAAGTAWGSGAITAGAIAADAIGASELAADAATEIGAAVVAALLSGLGAGLVIASGTIGATGNSTTALHLTGLPFGDDELNNHLILIRDVSTSENHARWIDDWADTGDLATVATLPFTPQNSTDTYVILSMRRDVKTKIFNETQVFGTGQTGDLWRGTA